MVNEKAAMPPSEQTPLIQVVHIAPHRDRYEHHTVSTLLQDTRSCHHVLIVLDQLRRFCTIALVSVPLFVIALVLISVAISGQSDLFGDDPSDDVTYSALKPPHTAWPAGNGLSFAELKQILSDTPDASKAKQWSEYYTAGPHLAGQNFSQAVWTKERWEEFGIKSDIVSYDVYINYPLDHRLALLKDGDVAFEASLEEDVLDEDPTSGLSDRVPTFHGYSASGRHTTGRAPFQHQLMCVRQRDVPVRLRQLRNLPRL